MNAKSLKNLLLDLLFPRRCELCGKVVGFSKNCGCKHEFDLLHVHPAPLKFNLPEKIHFEKAFACFEYHSPLRETIHRMKFGDQPELAAYFAGELAAYWQAHLIKTRVDLVVPTPVSSRTRRKRGYNQSELLASGFTETTGLVIAPQALTKPHNTPSQMTLSREDRLHNLAGAFQAEKEIVCCKHILLVDDIITTGSTANECAKTLLEAGAESVTVLGLAYSPDKKSR